MWKAVRWADMGLLPMSRYAREEAMSAGAGAQTLSYPGTQLPGPASVTVQMPADCTGVQRVMQTVRVTR